MGIRGRWGSMKCEDRKILKLGRVYYVSLPIHWIRAQGLKAGDKLRMFWSPDNPSIIVQRIIILK